MQNKPLSNFIQNTLTQPLSGTYYYSQFSDTNIAEHVNYWTYIILFKNFCPHFNVEESQTHKIREFTPKSNSSKWQIQEANWSWL